MSLWKSIRQPPWRTIIPACGLLLAAWLTYAFWTPGLDIRDGRHDRGRNGIWLSHGWLGGDQWFIRNGKSSERTNFRDPTAVRELAAKLHRNHITDVFPHLCPAEPDGRLPAVDDPQVERFLDAFDGFRVMPWIGGPNGENVRLDQLKWRTNFVAHVQKLMADHPRLAGLQINVEPLPTGDTNFLVLLEELRAALPPGKLLSVAAYPPPTRWHPYDDVHWNEAYFRQVAQHSDQMAVMMYDVGQKMPKLYQHIMAKWTQEELVWSGDKPVLLGIPTYNDAGFDYHDPKVENLTNALFGIHRGLSEMALPANFQGVAIYCDWKTSANDWSYFHDHFLKETLTK